MASMQGNTTEPQQRSNIMPSSSISQQQMPLTSSPYQRNPQQMQQPQQKCETSAQIQSMDKYLPPNTHSTQKPATPVANPVASGGQNMMVNTNYSMKPPIFSQNNPLTNGGSSHSSRTASPSLNYGQQVGAPLLQNQFRNSYLPSTSSPLSTTMASQTALNQNFVPNTSPGSNLKRSEPNLNNLSNSMQNLSLKQTTTNGAATPPLTRTMEINANQFATRLSGVGSSHPNIANSFAPMTRAISTDVPQSQPVQNSRPKNDGPLPQQMPQQNFANTSLQNNQHPNPANFYGTNKNQMLPPRASPMPSQASPMQRSMQQAQMLPPLTTPVSASSVQQFQSPNTRRPMYPPTSAQPVAPQPAGQANYSYGAQQSQQNQRQPQQQQPATSHQYQSQVQPQPQLQTQSQPNFNGYPNTSQLQYQGIYNQMSVAKEGFSKLWGQDTVDLMQQRHILPTERVQPPPIVLNNQFYESVNCSPEIIRCTVNKVPESNNLLQKSRLPLGILIHPFRDMSNLVVINCPTIVRCRLCRTYINPFVHFVDSKMWKCNLCYRINELPDDFQYDPVSKTYGEVTRRPEVRSSTIEFIAPAEYMLRPPQPAIYLFLFDVSIIAQQTGYLDVVCDILAKRLDQMPGDARTKVGFIAFNSEVHFYNMAEGYNQPHEITLVDIDDIFLPCPDNLLVNVNACRDLIRDLLSQLPTRFASVHDSGSALGAALQIAFKLMSSPGGRITVFQTCLPNKGPGSLQSREDPNNRSAKDILHLNPATDFYKRLALDCSGQQIAVDLFLLNQQYSDLATLSGMSKYSGGCIHHFPLYQKTKPQLVETLKRSFDRYLTRKIGFEAVMRVRCTRGLQIHTFHGNFFVRSTDLLSLPNVNPDAGYGMQISYEESLTDIKSVCFQAALLYTTSSGERRIRVHTMCLPVTASLTDVMYSADVQCIVGLLTKMAVDRSLSSSVSDARDAFINATVDILTAFKTAQNLPSGMSGQLVVPKNLSLLPLYIAAIMKHVAFRTGTSTRLDDRVFAMDAMKTLPLDQLIKYIYPEFYHLDALFYSNATENDDSDQQDPPLLQLSAEFIDSRSMFLLDCGTLIIIYVGMNVPTELLQSVLGIQSTSEISDYCFGLPTINTPENESLQAFIESLNENKPYDSIIQIIRDTSTCKSQFFEKLVDDRSESSLSYYEFLQHLRTQVK